jgi:hypothetical protein
METKIIMKSMMQWFMPVILGTWKAEIRKIMVSDKPRPTSSKTP